MYRQFPENLWITINEIHHYLNEGLRIPLKCIHHQWRLDFPSTTSALPEIRLEQGTPSDTASGLTPRKVLVNQNKRQLYSEGLNSVNFMTRIQNVVDAPFAAIHEPDAVSKKRVDQLEPKIKNPWYVINLTLNTCRVKSVRIVTSHGTILEPVNETKQCKMHHLP
jgi:hypothetical protein